MLKESEMDGVALGAPERARSATDEIKRWSSGRKKQVVLRLLRGESVDALSHELAVPNLSAGRVAQPRLGRDRCRSQGTRR